MKSLNADEVGVGQVDNQCAVIGYQSPGVTAQIVDVRRIDFAAEANHRESDVDAPPHTSAAVLDDRGAAVFSPLVDVSV